MGRERELNKIAMSLLAGTRLITLIGSGGIGKTRLATEALHRYHKARRIRPHWARLSRLSPGSDAAAVAEELAHAIIDGDFSDRSTWDALVETLTDTDGSRRVRQTILVVDNCEHVLAGAGEVIIKLLDAVPGLTVLATSRQRIGWIDEHLVPVPALSHEQALTLFCSRAELTGRPIADEDLAIAESICRRLHNHPLFIRLAAARLTRQPLTMIRRDLTGEDDDRRLQWPAEPRVGAEERHWRITDAIAWSFDLCRHKERLLLERLSVFASGCDTDSELENPMPGREAGADLAAIKAVCCDDDGSVIAPDEIEELLERLVDRSLVTIHRTPTAVRYSLLDSLRLFARQRLRERAGGKEWERFAARHRRYYRDMIVHAGAEWFGPDERHQLEWARAAWDNLLTAMDSSLAGSGEAVAGLEIAAGMIALRLPFFTGTLREARQWALRALEATRALDRQPVELQTTAMALIAWLTMCQGVPGEAARLLDDCVATCLPDQEAIAAWRGDSTADLVLPAPVDFARGTELLFTGDPAAVPVLARARERFDDIGNCGASAMSEFFHAMAAGLLGTRSQALPIARGYLDRANRSGAAWTQSCAELAWMIALIKHGDPQEALAVGRSALAKQLSIGDRWGASWSVHFRMWALARVIADTRAAQGAQPHSTVRAASEIATLAGGVRSLRRQLGVNIANLGPFATETEQAMAAARNVLGDKAFATAEREGSMLRAESGDVVQLALGTLPVNGPSLGHPAQRRQPTQWSELSSAEREVAVLAAAGWANTAIAAIRGSSFKTVNAQIASILTKLQIGSRNEIVDFVPADAREKVNDAATRRPPGRRPR
ncbi:LuxR C-terminal-related transcriptional regulator [Nocardia veterana]|uniref:LuxR C-terminal-related transcriptional regulator n=1 Tax=Nocardia veterana TaxID=132249 RepID=UPI000310D1D8